MIKNNFFETIDYLLLHKFKIIFIPIFITLIIILLYQYLVSKNTNTEYINFSYEIDFLEQNENLKTIELANRVLNLSSINSLWRLKLNNNKELDIVELPSFSFSKSKEISQNDLNKSFINNIKNKVYKERLELGDNKLYPSKIELITSEKVKNMQGFRLKFIFNNSKLDGSEEIVNQIIENTLEAINNEWKNILKNEIDKHFWIIKEYKDYYDKSRKVLGDNNIKTIELNEIFDDLNYAIIKKDIDQLFVNGSMIDIIQLSPIFPELIILSEQKSSSYIYRLSLALMIFFSFLTILIFIFIYEYKKYLNLKK